jgi:hypothetical protein
MAHEIFDPEHDDRVLVDHAFIVAGGEITKAATQLARQRPRRIQRSQIMFIDRNDILTLFVVTNLQLPDVAVPPSGPVPRDIGTSRAANVGDTVTNGAHGIGNERVMNDGNRFGRRPHIDLGPRRVNRGNTN